MARHRYRLRRKVVIRKGFFIERQSIVDGSDLALSQQELDVSFVSPSPTRPHLHGQQGALVGNDHLDTSNLDGRSPSGLTGYWELHPHRSDENSVSATNPVYVATDGDLVKIAYPSVKRDRNVTESATRAWALTWGRRRRIIGPVVARIARCHLPAHLRPATAPEPRKVSGDLDRAPGGRKHLDRDWDSALCDRRVDGGAIKVLGAHGDPRMLTVIGDCRAPAAGKDDRGWYQSVEIRDPATDPRSDDARHVDALEVRPARRPAKKWHKPHVNVGNERVVGACWPRVAEGRTRPPNTGLEVARGI
jgi:hypothetical protein